MDKKTGSAVIYDPSCFYGHNEYELGNWRHNRSRFKRSYYNAYTRHYPESEPKEDFHDCNMLYSL